MSINFKPLTSVFAIGVMVVIANPLAVAQIKDPIVFDSVAALGEALFFDVNLSQNRTQSCASCHDPAHGFADGRQSAAGGAFSLGDDGHSLGGRNAPTARYAMFSPKFHQTADGTYIGGQFWDGRAPDLAGQAGGPPLNPTEMGMPDKASVVVRLAQNPDYVAALQTYFGAKIMTQTDAAYEAMTQSIAAFEQTEVFAPFDSKYDRSLRGEYVMSDQEELGRLLFFSEQFTNCNQCHQLHASPLATRETFSDYKFYNIGVPTNVLGRAQNGVPPEVVDHGLLGNPAVDDAVHDGKFRTPTLRNVAVTGPYMHNGVFSDLRTVILFYNKYNSKSAARQINPQTNAPWAAPQVPDTIAIKELSIGPALEDQRIDALVAFLETLTDERYEGLQNP